MPLSGGRQTMNALKAVGIVIGGALLAFGGKRN
jgi:hypothetical protein